MSSILFNGWDGIWRTLVIGVLAYVALVIVLRVSGKRTLSKMNAFDLVVTVALGSTLATVLLSKNVALAEGVVAFALLAALQFAVTWTSIRSRWVQRLTKSDPALLFYAGQFLPDALRGERVTEEEVRAAVRSAQLGSLEEVAAVVLETDGSFSVLPRQNSPDESVLVHVRRTPETAPVD